ncbi:tol-pal system protein YbgF [Aurantivibrio infirmus]
MIRSKTFTAAMLAAVFVIQHSTLNAQVEVVESSPTIRAIGQSRSPVSVVQNTGNSAGNTQPDANALAELYFQVQQLQQEVQMLRGLVEEQGYTLNKLKQQHLDDYIDLDRRLSGGTPTLNSDADSGGQAGGISSSSNNTVSSSSRNGVPSSSQAAPQYNENERVSYEQALDMALNKKDYKNAIAALNELLIAYPNGQYAANAHYWLGELYVVDGKPQQARQWFSDLVTKFPNHSKTPDGKYKLGKIYFDMGDKAQAKILMTEVSKSGSDSASLAEIFLNENFP